MIHEMNLHPAPYSSISSEKKDIELRLFDEKRRKIRAGDVIRFRNTKSGEVLECVAKTVHTAPDFSEIYEKFDKVRLGYSEGDEAHPSDMEEYYSREEIEKYGACGIELLLLRCVTPAILVDLGICPTCFDRENGGALYGDKTDKILYEDELIECFLVGNPRAPGHVAISSKEHYKDMMEIPRDLCSYIFSFASSAMRVIRRVYSSASVYLCTMCDGPMNHFHVQLIPRYAHEERGSKNFVKNREEYVHDDEKIKLLREGIRSEISEL